MDNPSTRPATTQYVNAAGEVTDLREREPDPRTAVMRWSGLPDPERLVEQTATMFMDSPVLAHAVGNDGGSYYVPLRLIEHDSRLMWERAGDVLTEEMYRAQIVRQEAYNARDYMRAVETPPHDIEPGGANHGHGPEPAV